MGAGLNTKEVYKYQRRQPEKTLLFRIIETYWPLFIKEQARVNKKLPLFIHQELWPFHVSVEAFARVARGDE